MDYENNLALFHEVLERFTEELRSGGKLYRLADFLRWNPPSVAYQELSDKQGVYNILSPPLDSIYIGRTNDGNSEDMLSGRLFYQAGGDSKSDVLRLLSEVRGRRLPGDYLHDHFVRVVVIPDHLLRVAVEYYSTVVIGPEAKRIPGRLRG